MVTLRCKVLVLGDAKVGKSSLIQMLQSNGTKFPKNYIMTVGSELVVKSILIPETNATVELYIYDIAGQIMFKELVQRYWANPSMVCLVYDTTDRQTFHSIGNWIKALKRSCNIEQLPPGVIVANKGDRSQYSEVTPTQAAEFAHAHNLEYFETSALDGTDIEMPFNFVANAFYRRYAERIQELDQI
eukprot:gnl/Trimastix_PCT/2295.p1 GENE.gnl/Trimastix_PCT/2295~~gnl/Trimastix_PCT/2295.p1  ORF type:complete len:187 (+),score=41.83 gnl/Trimastix_PCT/2295:66-626(+)